MRRLAERAVWLALALGLVLGVPAAVRGGWGVLAAPADGMPEQRFAPLVEDLARRVAPAERLGVVADSGVPCVWLRFALYPRAVVWLPPAAAVRRGPLRRKAVSWIVVDLACLLDDRRRSLEEWEQALAEALRPAPVIRRAGPLAGALVFEVHRASGR